MLPGLTIDQNTINAAEILFGAAALAVTSWYVGGKYSNYVDLQDMLPPSNAPQNFLKYLVGIHSAPARCDHP